MRRIGYLQVSKKLMSLSQSPLTSPPPSLPLLPSLPFIITTIATIITITIATMITNNSLNPNHTTTTPTWILVFKQSIGCETAAAVVPAMTPHMRSVTHAPSSSPTGIHRLSAMAARALSKVVK